MILLAAAVSDFYLPWATMAEHKIQSAAQGDGLHLDLEPVPKALGCVGGAWAPSSMVVSFKLETDEDLVVPKATRSLAKYGVQAVVANRLDTRYDEVKLVARPVGDPGREAEWTEEALLARA